jgi:hypothetical protein
MKTFKITLLKFIITLAFCSKSSAQVWYEEVGGGYGFPIDGQTIFDETALYPGAGNPSASWDTKTLSFGKGIDIGGTSGGMVTKNFGVEVSGYYLAGASTAQTLSTTENTQPTTTTVLTYSSQIFRLIPAIRLEIGDRKFHPYMVIGAIIGFPANTTVKETGTGISNVDSNNYSGGFSYGFNGRLGIRYAFTPKVSAYIELNGDFQNYSPVRNITNGGVAVTYVNSGSYNTNVQQNSISLPTISLPFSSLGIHIGVHFAFFEEPKAKGDAN